MADMMQFPNTVEEFMEQYKIIDTEQVYTNGAELVPIFRMKQWFDHIEGIPSAERRGRWFIKKDVTFPHMVCSECKKPFYGNMNDTWNYCPNCGARMEVE